ncbi:hypothetical protein I4641_18955, partial [Waterburya agarophytonicola K14]|nr:hypothetical protein [Waterburya agarophytonicola KI4]
MANQTNITTNSLISQDWDGGYKVELDITAQSKATEWTLDFELPYEISAAYGVDLIDNGDGSYTISGQNDQVDLTKGQSINPILIVKNNGQETPSPQFIYDPSEMTEELMMEEGSTSDKESEKQAKSIDNPLSASPSIVEDWDGGYKIELDITAQSKAQDWTMDFNLPYEISAAYGVDLVNNGDGSYTINGQNDQADLNKGQSIKPLLIVQDNGQEALAPSFGESVNLLEPAPEPTLTPEIVDNSNNDSDPVSAPVNIPEGNGQSVGQQGK